MMRCLSIVFMALIFVSLASVSEAGIGSLLGKGVRHVVGKGAAKAGGKAASGAGKVAAAGVRVSGRMSTSMAGVASRGAASASNAVLRNLGTSGALVMAKLPGASVGKLAELSSRIARSPYKADWLKLLNGRHASAVLDFLWRHKGGILVAGTATGVVLAPADFFAAVGGVAEAGVDAAGKHVTAPVIAGIAHGIAEPVGKAVANRIDDDPWWWLYPYLTVAAIGGFAWHRCRRQPAKPN